MDSVYDYPTDNPDGLDGSFGHLDSDQIAKVTDLQQRVGKSDRSNTLALIRFLRKQNWDVDLAAQTFQEAEQWRKDIGVDQLYHGVADLNEHKVLELYPQFIHGKDKRGMPVYYAKAGMVDTTKLFQVTTEDKLLQYLVHLYEVIERDHLPQCSRDAGHLIEQFVMILDLQGLSIYSAPSLYSLVAKTAPVSNKYYPKRVNVLYFLNAPWIFSSIFATIKRLIGEQALGEYHVLGADYQAFLLDKIDAAELPLEYGGEAIVPSG